MLQHGGGVCTGLCGGGIIQRAAQGTERQVGFLRQKQRLRFDGSCHVAVDVRPQPGHGAQQGGFADAGAAAYQQRGVGVELEVEVFHQCNLRRSAYGEGVYRDAVLARLDVRGGQQSSSVHALEKAGETIEHGAVTGEFVIRAAQE